MAVSINELQCESASELMLEPPDPEKDSEELSYFAELYSECGDSDSY